MRSAYVVLGVPGNATPEEIELAFRQAELQFPRERLAEEEGALDRFEQIRNAYKVLRDPESREAHDRRLQDAITPQRKPRTVIIESDDPSPMRRLFLGGVLLAAVIFGAAAYASWHATQVRKEQAALELAAQKAAAEAALRKREEDEREETARAAQARQAQIAERRLAIEAQYTAARAAAITQAQEASALSARRQELYEQQRREAQRQDEDRRAAYEARLRIERDKARVRELCWQNYHRGDC